MLNHLAPEFVPGSSPQGASSVMEFLAPAHIASDEFPLEDEVSPSAGLCQHCRGRNRVGKILKPWSQHISAPEPWAGALGPSVCSFALPGVVNSRATASEHSALVSTPQRPAFPADHFLLSATQHGSTARGLSTPFHAHNLITRVLSYGALGFSGPILTFFAPSSHCADFRRGPRRAGAVRRVGTAHGRAGGT